MKYYLLPEKGNFYKANLHLHTNLSDGALSPEEVKAKYKSNGYSILAYTDHEVIIPHHDLNDEDFLTITSYELALEEDIEYTFSSVKATHLNFYAKDKDNIIPPFFDEDKISEKISGTRPYITDGMRARKYKFEYSSECINEVIAKANEEGFLVSYNHPVWNLHNYEDYKDYKGLWGVECYNHECAITGLVDSMTPIDDLLHRGEKVFTLATDDSHREDSCCGGYVMIKAEELEYGAVMTALERGDFYASIGPEIKVLTLDDCCLHIECSDAAEIIVNTDKRIAYHEIAPEGGTINSKDFYINYWVNENKRRPEKDRPNAYFRVTVIDKSGNRAWTNAYFYENFEF